MRTPADHVPRLRQEPLVGNRGINVRHVDRGTAALLALGEEVDDGERDHARRCPGCAATVASIRADLFRLNDPDATGALPPVAIWRRILLRLDASPDPDTHSDPGADPGADLDPDPDPRD